MGNQFESKQLLKRILVDLIATCVYGIEIDSFKNPDNDFHKIALKVNLFESFSSSIKLVGHHFLPSLMKSLKVKLVDDETLNYFNNMVKDTIERREITGISRNDMIQHLMQAKVRNRGLWDDDDLIAQAYIFFVSGELQFGIMKTSLKINK